MGQNMTETPSLGFQARISAAEATVEIHGNSNCGMITEACGTGWTAVARPCPDFQPCSFTWLGLWTLGPALMSCISLGKRQMFLSSISRAVFPVNCLPVSESCFSLRTQSTRPRRPSIPTCGRCPLLSPLLPELFHCLLVGILDLATFLTFLLLFFHVLCAAGAMVFLGSLLLAGASLSARDTLVDAAMVSSSVYFALDEVSQLDASSVALLSTDRALTISIGLASGAVD